MSWPVWLFVPNLIGYFRVATACISVWYAFSDYRFSALMYFLSYFSDMFDGYAARWLNQSTKFGAVLDMITDRASSMCLLIILSHLYQEKTVVFIFFSLLDIFAHWVQMYAQLLSGSQSHKTMSASEPFLMRIYYTFPYALVILVAANEAFLQALYLAHFETGHIITIGGIAQGAWAWVAYISAPFFILKQTISVVAFFHCIGKIIKYDEDQIKAAASASVTKKKK